MKTLVAIAMLVSASLSLHAQEEKQRHRNPKVAEELKKLVQLWDAAITRGDVSTLDWLLAPEFSIGGSTKEEYISWVQGRELAIDSAVSDDFDVKVYGSTAVLTARETIHGRDKKGAAVTLRFRYIDVWVKRSGQWRCVATESYPIEEKKK